MVSSITRKIDKISTTFTETQNIFYVFQIFTQRVKAFGSINASKFHSIWKRCSPSDECVIVETPKNKSQRRDRLEVPGFRQTAQITTRDLQRALHLPVNNVATCSLSHANCHHPQSYNVHFWIHKQTVGHLCHVKCLLKALHCILLFNRAARTSGVGHASAIINGSLFRVNSEYKRNYVDREIVFYTSIEELTFIIIFQRTNKPSFEHLFEKRIHRLVAKDEHYIHNFHRNP